MNNKELYKLTDLTRLMKTNSIENYFLDGLRSSLLENGKCRLFEATRHQTQSLAPHSHRYDFSCLVLQGEVTNHIWNEVSGSWGDLFNLLQLTYKGIGSYDQKVVGQNRYQRVSIKYTKGELYSMKSHQLHNITFSKDAIVLFFEGPQLKNTSWALTPEVEFKENSKELGDLL